MFNYFFSLWTFLKILSVGIFCGLGLKDVLLVGNTGRFKFSLSLLVHTAEFWTHTHQTSGSWLKSLTGGFSCLQLPLELRLRLAFNPKVCLWGAVTSPCDLIEGVLQGSWLFTWHIYMYMFLVACWVILGYELPLEYFIKLSMWDSWWLKCGLLSSREDLLFKTSAGSLGTKAFEATLTPSRGHSSRGAVKINSLALPSTSTLSWGSCPSARGGICATKTLPVLVAHWSHFRFCLFTF